jgi:hypothetical protein
MLRTIEAVIEPDGTVRLLEPVDIPKAQRALVTLLPHDPVPEHTPETPAEPQSERERIHAILVAGGVVQPRTQAESTAQPLSHERREELARLFAVGKPLSQIIIEEREEGW